MKGKFVKVKIVELKKNPLRSHHGSREELESLADSWLRRPVHPIVCRSDLTVADGHRRLEGLALRGKTEVEVFVTDEPLTDVDLLEIGLITDIHRESVPVADKCKAVLKYREAKGANGKRLAELLNTSEATVSKLVSYGDCVREVQEALELGRIGISACYEISKAPADRQRQLLADKLSGATRDELAAKVRRPRTESKPLDRAKRIACPLPSGVSIIATGRKLSLDDLIVALGEAQKAARSAKAEGLDARTFSAVMADKAKSKSVSDAPASS